MTKKHFIQFASYIKNHQSQYVIAADVKAEKLALANMVIACQDNPNFDRSRFLTACGLN